MFESTIRHIEVPIPRQTFRDLLETHLRAVSYLNDDEDVEIGFETRHLKREGPEIPVSLTIISKRKEDNRKQIGT